MASKEKIPDAGIYELMNVIRRLTRSSLMHQYAVAEKMRLNVTDAECIDFLMEMGPSTAGDLAKVTRLTTGAITSAIDRLESAGYVKRDKDPADRRKVVVKLIPKKLEKAKQYYAAMAKDVFDLIAGYSTVEIKLLRRHTELLTGIYQQHAQQVIQQKT